MHSESPVSTPPSFDEVSVRGKIKAILEHYIRQPLGSKFKSFLSEALILLVNTITSGSVGVCLRNQEATHTVD